MSKQYKFLKPYKHFPHWAKEPYHFDRGHIVTQDPDGWVTMDEKQGGLRFSPSLISQLQVDNFLQPIDDDD